jgi:hypothetical protein
MYARHNPFTDASESHLHLLQSDPISLGSFDYCYKMTKASSKELEVWTEGREKKTQRLKKAMSHPIGFAARYKGHQVFGWWKISAHSLVDIIK